MCFSHVEGLISNLVDVSKDVPLVDWSTLHIVKYYDEEGHLAIMADEQMYAYLGLMIDDEISAN
jgi:hypothetical protein